VSERNRKRETIIQIDRQRKRQTETEETETGTEIDRQKKRMCTKREKGDKQYKRL
jgi:hypothetical protein